jgi:hypothetical protein
MHTFHALMLIHVYVILSDMQQPQAATSCLMITYLAVVTHTCDWLLCTSYLNYTTGHQEHVTGCCTLAPRTCNRLQCRSYQERASGCCALAPRTCDWLLRSSYQERMTGWCALAPRTFKQRPTWVDLHMCAWDAWHASDRKDKPCMRQYQSNKGRRKSKACQGTHCRTIV